MIISPQGYVHATAIAIGGRGVLIRGRSGTGKSRLAEALIQGAEGAGRSSELVGDDRVRLVAGPSGVDIMPHPCIAGLIERRGEGIEALPYTPSARLALILELGGGAPSPGEHATAPLLAETASETVLGHAIAKIGFPAKPAIANVLPLVLAALAK
jgi:serine kinase of HPr protein (carbohydrate metabolism regulator)